MKKALYSFVACSLFVFVFIQCNSSPTQENTTVLHQWKDSLIMDVFSVGLFLLQHDTTVDVRVSTKGQTLFNPANLLYQNSKVYAVTKHQPSHYEILQYLTGTLKSGYDSTFTDTNTYYILKPHNAPNSISYSLKSVNPICFGHIDMVYFIGLGFQLPIYPSLGVMKIYYE